MTELLTICLTSEHQAIMESRIVVSLSDWVNWARAHIWQAVHSRKRHVKLSCLYLYFRFKEGKKVSEMSALEEAEMSDETDDAMTGKDGKGRGGFPIWQLSFLLCPTVARQAHFQRKCDFLCISHCFRLQDVP